jgi:hypothetical protein
MNEPITEGDQRPCPSHENQPARVSKTRATSTNNESRAAFSFRGEGGRPHDAKGRVRNEPCPQAS